MTILRLALKRWRFTGRHFIRMPREQTPGGKWSSKLGKAEDIEHDTPDDVAGGIYGEVVQILKRRVTNELRR